MKGLTLIELIATMAILTIILAIGTPSLKGMLENHHAKTTLSTLQRTLHRARILALSKSQAVLVCPMVNKRCIADWNQPLAIFTDSNNNKIVDNNETIKTKISNENSHGYWQKKRSAQNYIKFSPQGHAFSSATTFLYCPYSGAQHYAKQLVINFQGRIRINSYLRPQGTPYPNISPLACADQITL